MDFGIRVIFGKFGAGKGVSNAIFGISEMFDSERFNNGLLGVEELEEKYNRPFKRPPQNHLVFSNFKLKKDGLESYDFDPDSFMLPNEEFDYDIFPPYSSFHVEEGQSGTFNSYDWSSFPKPALLGMARLRHAHYLFTIDLQFVSNLNKNLRKFAFEYITPFDLQHEYNCLNVLIKTKVVWGVFKSYEKAVEYETTQDSSLFEEIREFEFLGDIYSCYDSYSKKEEFFDVPNDKDFCYELVKKEKKKIEIGGIIL